MSQRRPAVRSRREGEDNRPQLRPNGIPSHAPNGAAHAADGGQSGKLPSWVPTSYFGLCLLGLVAALVWFFFIRNPFSSHPAYDPLKRWPPYNRDELHYWYRLHGNDSTKFYVPPPSSLTPIHSTPQNSTSILEDLFDFLRRLEHQGLLNPLSGTSQGFEHLYDALMQGFVPGVLESLEWMNDDDGESAKLRDAIEKERAGVGSIEGGSRRLKQLLAQTATPIVKLIQSGDNKVGQNATSDNNQSAWSQLSPETQFLFFEGLSHCHSSQCRLAKMQLISTWTTRNQRDPDNEQKELTRTLIQLFHPDTHDYKIMDAPASASSLVSLWFRFFSSGDLRYLHRLIELTTLTGGKPYQEAKDEEIRVWDAKQRAKEERQYQERVKEAKKQAKKEGKTKIDLPPHPPQRAPLPPSPTKELHDHFFQSLVHYAWNHPSVRSIVWEAHQKRPTDPVLQRLVQAQPIRGAPRQYQTQ